MPDFEKKKMALIVGASTKTAPSKQAQEKPQVQSEDQSKVVALAADDPIQKEEDLISELAKLSELDYERARSEAQKELGITRAGTLDRLVKQRRSEMAAHEERDELRGGVEPWPCSVEGLQLADTMLAALNRYAILPEGADTALVLWAFGTYCYNSFRIFPKLCLSSPEKRCGKTTTLETLSAFTHRTLLASNITPSVIFRAVESWHPTLLIDEGDTFVDGNEELRGIINSGHTRSTAYVWRTEGDSGNREPTRFSTWSPMAIAMIKTPPDTIKDRSVMVKLRRKMPGEAVAKLPPDIKSLYFEHRQKMQRWAKDNSGRLLSAHPKAPTTGNDRADDNWMPLLAIAEVLGGDWSTRAADALKALNADFVDDDSGIGPMILSDIRDVLSEKNLIRISSEDLLVALVDMEERPWCEWRGGSPITKHGVAKQLRPFGIKSKKLREGCRTYQGYEREMFEDAFSRYLAPPEGEPSSPPAELGTSEQPSNEEACSVPITKTGSEHGRNMEQSRNNFAGETEPLNKTGPVQFAGEDVPTTSDVPTCSDNDFGVGTLQPSSHAGCSGVPSTEGECGTFTDDISEAVF